MFCIWDLLGNFQAEQIITVIWKTGLGFALNSLCSLQTLLHFQFVCLFVCFPLCVCVYVYVCVIIGFLGKHILERQGWYYGKLKYHRASCSYQDSATFSHINTTCIIKRFCLVLISIKVYFAISSVLLFSWRQRILEVSSPPSLVISTRLNSSGSPLMVKIICIRRQ